MYGSSTRYYGHSEDGDAYDGGLISRISLERCFTVTVGFIVKRTCS